MRFCAAIVMVVAAGAAGCGGGAGAPLTQLESVKAGALQIVLLADHEALRHGKDTFVLEFRGSTSEGSINKGGRFQTQLRGVEAEVKDSTFKDGWAFFNFGPANALQDSAEPLPDDAGCRECHTKNTAVERTFVQFYPTLLEVARKMKTVKPGF